MSPDGLPGKQALSEYETIPYTAIQSSRHIRHISEQRDGVVSHIRLCCSTRSRWPIRANFCCILSLPEIQAMT